MASSSGQSIDEGRQNFLKSFVALFYTKEGLEVFILEEIAQFQTDILTYISTNCLPSGTVCTSCTTANVLPCPTIGFCTSGGRCRLHKANDPTRKADTQCNICKTLRDRIRLEHRYYVPNKVEPSWKNADATQFCTDPFQILKCYLPPEGYSNVQSVKETDFNGVISVIINCKRFQNKLSAKLSQHTNVFVEVS